jgi:YesN/AraC family two-component response regulator
MTNYNTLKILVVDDELQMRELLQEALPIVLSRQIVVDLASCGASGLSKIANSRPDLIITDINMPNLDGVDMVDQARQLGYNGPIVMMSGNADLPKGKDYPILRKPFILQGLGKTVNLELKRYSL